MGSPSWCMLVETKRRVRRASHYHGPQVNTCLVHAASSGGAAFLFTLLVLPLPKTATFDGVPCFRGLGSLDIRGGDEHAFIVRLRARDGEVTPRRRGRGVGR